MLVSQRVVRWLLRRTRLGLVMFGHGLSTGSLNEVVSNSNVHLLVDQFRQIITFYRSLDFRFIDLNELTQLARQGFPREGPWMHLTFDDGYASNIDLLQPLLHDMDIPWTVFVSTHHIETGQRMGTFLLRCAIHHALCPIEIPWLGQVMPADADRAQRERFYRQIGFKQLAYDDQLKIVDHVVAQLNEPIWRRLLDRYPTEKMMSRSQLRGLDGDSLVAIGSHGHHHVVLCENVADQHVREEMCRSNRWLEKTLGRTVNAFCYPNGREGDFSPMTRSACASCGYELAFTTIPRPVTPGTDPLEIPRRSIPPNIGRARRKLTKIVMRAAFSTNPRIAGIENKHSRVENLSGE